ncbi:hypothetical protein PUR61_01015 [Streptomyces sp. BE20]|uniref:hypothetical protein n=1 Tax=Streptomyces sp. BE20 TaxID=3002525 RepID=UPI002E784EE4|nr:hypothetical protein [Streptomyces sp. BE20]MEE1820791.1 hypothetical protein [Streptomyces sp. BE20]
MTPDQMLRVLAALEAAWTGDALALESLAHTGPGEKPLPVAIADYADLALQSLTAAAHGVRDGLPPDEIQAAAARMVADTGTRMTELLAQTLQLWAASPAGPATVDDMAHVVISAILTFTPDGEPEQVLPMLAQLRAAALANRR